MTKYRKKPVELEAWQVGSDEPKPEWVKRVMLFDEPESGTWLIKSFTKYGYEYVEFMSDERFRDEYGATE